MRALSEIGRVEDAIVLLKSVIATDQPGEVTQTFNKEVMECVKAAVDKLENPDLTLEYNKVEKLFEKEGHISDLVITMRCHCLPLIPFFRLWIPIYVQKSSSPLS